MNARRAAVMLLSFAIAGALALAGAAVQEPEPPPGALPVGAKVEPDRIDVFVGGELFTSYRFGREEKYPYLWPVTGPASGQSITTESSEPYPHHHSLFFACDRVNGGNFWQESNERGQIVSAGPRIVEADGAVVVLSDSCLWRVPGMDPLLEDQRRIAITAPDPGLRLIDFTIMLRPIVDVVIFKTNHSLFAARVAPELSCLSGGALVNAEGCEGEGGTFGRKSSWCDYSGKRGGIVEGIAILQHPDNPWYPAPWFTRDYGFFSPTPMNWLDEDGLDLPAGKDLTLRYRVAVHCGDAREAGVADLFAEYAQDLRRKPEPPPGAAGAEDVRLITLAPGHFHAALVQKTMYEGVSPRVHVYAPGGPEVQDHLARINGFNGRDVEPTSWQEVVHVGADFVERMVAERPGNVAVLSGNNRIKAGLIATCAAHGLNVLADKPMCIDGDGFRMLERAFADAEEKGILIYDIMTERFEITSILQKELAANPAVLGDLMPGGPDDPAVVMESVHHFCKAVAGSPVRRPVWFFDTDQQGEGIADVAVHLVDLVMWELFPGEPLDYDRDVVLAGARRWPTKLSREQFAKATGEEDFPAAFKSSLDAGGLYPCFANGEIVFAVKGIHARVAVEWRFQAPEGGGDAHYSMIRGSRSKIIVRRDEETGQPELFVEPAARGQEAVVAAALAAAVGELDSRYAGVALQDRGDGWRVTIPGGHRTGHEAHFRQVMENFLRYLRAGALPEWEVPNMLAKYRITTQALDRARQ